MSAARFVPQSDLGCGLECSSSNRRARAIRSEFQVVRLAVSGAMQRLSSSRRATLIYQTIQSPPHQGKWRHEYVDFANLLLTKLASFNPLHIGVSGATTRATTPVRQSGNLFQSPPHRGKWRHRSGEAASITQVIGFNPLHIGVSGATSTTIAPTAYSPSPVSIPSTSG